MASWCSRQLELINPLKECQFGYTWDHYCKKIVCLKGPDEDCVDDMVPTGGHCAPGLRCCDICVGCLTSNSSHCAKQNCDLANNLKSKKASVNPLWFLDVPHRQEEQKYLRDIKQQQQQEQIERNKQQSPAEYYSINPKPILYMRSNNYPLNNFDY